MIKDSTRTSISMNPKLTHNDVLAHKRSTNSKRHASESSRKYGVLYSQIDTPVNTLVGPLKSTIGLRTSPDLFMSWCASASPWPLTDLPVKCDFEPKSPPWNEWTAPRGVKYFPPRQVTYSKGMHRCGRETERFTATIPVLSFFRKARIRIRASLTYLFTHSLSWWWFWKVRPRWWWWWLGLRYA